MIKDKFKNIKIIMEIYDRLLPYYCVFFTKSAIRMLYRQTFQKELNLDNPQDFNEKINWLKVYCYKRDPLVARCADKFRMREYVKECGYEDILIPLIGVYNSIDEIDWNKLPDQFVLKFNKAAGMNIICKDKSQLDPQKTLKEAKSWFKAECGERYGELHYRRTPSKLICEQYLDDGSGKLPSDYKVFCFNGEPTATVVCTERENGVKFLYVDNDYQVIDILAPGYGGGILPEKPVNFEAMLEISRKLSRPFSHVRVDFYEVQGHIYIGELTFTSDGGFARDISQKGLDWFGSKIKLPSKHYKSRCCDLGGEQLR